MSRPPAAIAGVRSRHRRRIAPWRVRSRSGDYCRKLIDDLPTVSKAWKSTTRCRTRTRSLQTLDILCPNGAKACRTVRCTHVTKAVLSVSPGASGVRLQARRGY